MVSKRSLFRSRENLDNVDEKDSSDWMASSESKSSVAALPVINEQKINLIQSVMKGLKTGHSVGERKLDYSSI